MCKLDECCCGCSLRTGTIAIGVSSLATSIGVIIVRAINISTFRPISLNDNIMYYYLCIGHAVLSMLTTALVLFSTWKNRMPRLLLPWLVMQITALIAFCSFLLFWAVVFIAAGIPTGIGNILGACAVGALGFYFWLVVLSYYQELKVKAMIEQQETEKGAEQFHD
ncbi:uncharacterized protein LOC124207878 [Daphnia pulex]|uniref:uncharacterized protein LOC124207878 n=1 Tax=Daphnia pulex TaxID=6669 RepID=UPI001EE0ACB7|nr:uncharacterized protein LOC124207878 [Daphnia pulex]